MINLQIRRFKEQIIFTTNATDLPIEIKRLVFSDILKELQDASDDMIRKEMILEKEKLEGEGESNEQSPQQD